MDAFILLRLVRHRTIFFSSYYFPEGIVPLQAQFLNKTTPLLKSRMLNLVLFGPPGAGKGTQSEKLIQQYKLVHLSTGDLLRSQIAAGTELGLRAKQLMDHGLLVPDEVVIGMIESKLEENQAANKTASVRQLYFRRLYF